jgi:phospholipid transport system transporter-binding protein
MTTSSAIASDDDRFAIVCVSPGVYSLSGALSFVNARAALRTVGDVLAESQGDVRFDLRDISRADSAGLAVLIECLRLAGRRRVSLTFSNLPSQVEALAAVSGVDAMLPRAAGAV